MQFIRLAARCGIMLSISAASQAATAMTPSQLLQRCQQDSLAEKNFCDGYVAGAIDAGRASGQVACIPDDISTSTLAELAMNSLRGSDDSASNASASINTRLAAVFPCSAENAAPEAKQPVKENWSNKDRLGK